ncbi:uncharacterized protein PRCAT00002394001 [Priceomyces carsonii]|uniref:uncharacterized protein n=1 Tax=Priceomyces carsonii TaxID=28549 RepID=UPI002ED8E997|nr:unnamed protein product [Priceomyces carsonii]
MDPRPTCFTSKFHEWMVLFIVCMAQFLTQGGITMSLSTMNIITESFEAASGQSVESSQKVWFMGLFALTVGTFMLISGKLGDLFGLKLIFNIGWIWVTLWSLLTGVSYYSKSIIFFIVCRAFQGFGFALLIPSGVGLIGSIYQNGARKNFAFGLIGASGPTGATIGALFAAIFSELVWWPWAFWMMAILAAIFGMLSYFVIPLDVKKSATLFKEKLMRMDFLGSSVGVSGLILLNFVWNQGPESSWSAVYVIVLLVISMLLIILFFYLELKVVKYPLLPRSVFNLKIGLVLLIISFGWGSFGIWQYYYWSIILNLRHYSPIQGGLTYIPLFILGVVAALCVSAIISRTKPSYLLALSAITFMSGCIMLSVMPVHQTFFRVSLGMMFVLCWAMDVSFPSASIILSDYLPAYHQGMAGSLVSTVINYSVSLFLAIASTVESQVLQRTGDELKSYRSAINMGTGVAGLSVLFSLIFIFIQRNDDIGTFESTEDKEDLLNHNREIS